jgi:hypothetical protein
MQMDWKSATAFVVTVGLVAAVIVALLKGHTELAITFATLLVPSAGQIVHGTTTATVTKSPDSASVKVDE